MGDLEELIFTRNLPGRYSRWEEENDDLIPDEDDAEIEENDDPEPSYLPHENQQNQSLEDKILNSDVPDSIREGILVERLTKHNTGVKGVLADYKASQKLKRAEHEKKKQDRNAILNRMATGAKRIEYDEDDNFDEEADNPEDDDDLDDDEDDAFMREFRAKRLLEIKNQRVLPVFGNVKEVTSSDFIDEVEKVDPQTVVIVHLYETSILPCVRMNRILEEIAKSMLSVKFLRMNASSNEIEVDRVALPMLNVYKGGECIEVLAGFTLEYGEYFTKDEVEWMIETRLTSN